ncbi:esterase-like activity of phytase family protein [Amorphus coralli]|uniref:esterase-like activity of phytase family protein n=1 Tax=Amorphus coralli TaxID=340680 RepID=UPI0003702874|nr:esterase-like activity of phytase family protein [Amorphus coralli]
MGDKPNGSKAVSRAATLAVVALGIAALAAPPALADPIRVESQFIRQFHVRDPARRIGDLTFLGGLVLTSRSRDFGGYSGLVASEDGARLTLVSDYGDWLTVVLDQQADGTPSGVRSADSLRRRATNGAPVDAKRDGDAEAVTRFGDGLLVSVESARQLLLYPGPDPTAATPKVLALPAETRCLPGNGNLEAIAVAPDASPVAGTIVLFAERGCADGPVATGSGALPVWLVAPDGTTRRVTLAKDGDFRPTDAAFLEGGDLLLLERRYNGGFDIGMRIRRLPREAFAGAGPLDGPVLVEADFAYEIDNMEGLALSRDSHGRTLITLVSDDNRSILQRTLILRFRLERGAEPPLRPGAADGRAERP